MKKILAFVLVCTFTIASMPAWAQPAPDAPPNFIGVFPFTGNASTDPHWNSRSGNFGGRTYDQAQGSSSHTNANGTPSMLLDPLATSHRADLSTTVINHYDAATNPVPHILNFWYQGSWPSGDFLSVQLGGQAFFPNVFNGSTAWKKASYSVLAFTNAQLTLQFLYQHDSSTFFLGAGIDAVQWIPQYPATTNAFQGNTNFWDVVYDSTHVKLTWNTNAYQGYTLGSSSYAGGPFQPISVVLVTNSPYISTIVTSTGAPNFYRLMK